MHSCVFNSNVVCHWIILSQNFARLICCSCVSATLKNGRVRYAFAAWISQLENKLPSIEDRGQTDHVIITATLLNGDFDFKSPASYRHDQCTRKNQGQGSVGAEEKVETYRLTDTTDRITLPSDAVGKRSESVQLLRLVRLSRSHRPAGWSPGSRWSHFPCRRRG